MLEKWKKVREKSKNFVSPEKWEAWSIIDLDHLYVSMRVNTVLTIVDF